MPLPFQSIFISSNGNGTPASAPCFGELPYVVRGRQCDFHLEKALKTIRMHEGRVSSRVHLHEKENDEM